MRGRPRAVGRPRVAWLCGAQTSSVTEPWPPCTVSVIVSPGAAVNVVKQAVLAYAMQVPPMEPSERVAWQVPPTSVQRRSMTPPPVTYEQDSELESMVTTGGGAVTVMVTFVDVLALSTEQPPVALACGAAVSRNGVPATDRK